MNLTYVLGGSPTASGGTPPYTYLWTPSAGLSSATVPNPTLTPNLQVSWYFVTVRDANGGQVKDSVNVNHYPFNWASAGPDISICVGDTGILGAGNPSGGGLLYSWSPPLGLNNPNLPSPEVTINTTTTYSVTISSSNCPTKVDQAVVTVHPLPNVNTTGATTILQGGYTPLPTTGASQYYWSPAGSLTFANTCCPDAAPTTTTTYTVIGVDQNGCANWDTVTVFVIPHEAPIFYNTFTPNNDGENEVFFIGNLFRYPENSLEVYNRYGQLIFRAAPYRNDWAGRSFGDEVPSATYYFIFDPGTGGPKHYGSVTIIR
jgi:gliding motility-associated-like protein